MRLAYSESLLIDRCAVMDNEFSRLVSMFGRYIVYFELVLLCCCVGVLISLCCCISYLLIYVCVCMCILLMIKSSSLHAWAILHHALWSVTIKSSIEINDGDDPSIFNKLPIHPPSKTSSQSWGWCRFQTQIWKDLKTNGNKVNPTSNLSCHSTSSTCSLQ